MSFDSLAVNEFTPKKEEIALKFGEKSFTFYANELSHLQMLQIYASPDAYSKLVLSSITDQDGAKMTKGQLEKLSAEHQELFFVAAAKVNKQEENKKKA